MIRTLISVTAALLISTVAYAEPLNLTDSQMDQVTAGFSINPIGRSPITIASNNGGDLGNDLLDVSGVTLPDAPSEMNALWNGHIHSNSPGVVNNP